MDSLPSELLSRIAYFLPCTPDLISLRLVNKRFAAIASRPLFEMLRFSGRRQDEPAIMNFGPNEPVLDPGRVGRTKTVDFSNLAEAVDEVIDGSLACHTKTFVFDPAYYRQKFWQDYLMQVENEEHEPVDEADFDLDGYEDEADMEAAIERALEWRRARPDREKDVLESAQAMWDKKIAEQEQNKEAVEAALARLFRVMTCLEKIVIKPWEFDGTFIFPDLESCNSYEIDVQRRDSFPCTFFLEVLARALYAADRRIKHLHVQEFFVEHLHDSPAIRHVFTGLQHISLNITHVEFLYVGAQKSELLIELFKHAQPTLRRLSIMAGGKWPSLPARGTHSLLKMVGDGTDKNGGMPLVFPQLEFFKLGGIILGTPPLVQFFNAQPNLKQLEFSHIYLSTNGFAWPNLIEALPAAVERWTVRGYLGHEPFRPPFDDDAPAAYNWMKEWTLLEQLSLPGWKGVTGADGLYFERVV
ncbi:hypothetical protein F5B22DRAFT_630845 [Xylaria bambusicola]|uniref:uncharacterized protein n=1 Tax=Xylaria bambusicola TaxID=326684 RepID=UPI0020085BF7|nr:uncharacterized protein F5B22DRAFT_630845 [Xylaria bambusicola]KAI0503026.1 hypothetical protein F5B22DRAFT_630845 [Xylaria bambusicola]